MEPHTGYTLAQTQVSQGTNVHRYTADTRRDMHITYANTHKYTTHKDTHISHTGTFHSHEYRDTSHTYRLHIYKHNSPMGIDVRYKKYTKLHKSCPKIHTHKYITLIHRYHIHIHTATHIICTETRIDNTGIHTEHTDTQRYITYLNIRGHTHHKCIQISHKVTKRHYPSVVTHYIHKYTQTEHIQRHTQTHASQVPTFL